MGRHNPVESFCDHTSRSPRLVVASDLSPAPLLINGQEVQPSFSPLPTQTSTAGSTTFDHTRLSQVRSSERYPASASLGQFSYLWRGTGVCTRRRKSASIEFTKKVAVLVPVTAIVLLAAEFSHQKCQPCRLKTGQTTSPFLSALQLQQGTTRRTLVPLVPLQLRPPTILLGLKLRPRRLDIRFWDLCAQEVVHLPWDSSHRHRPT